MRKLLRNERGFSLLELLIVLGIMSAIGSAMAMTTATIVTITPQGNNEIIALRQAQNAGYWITRDILQTTAHPIETNPPGGEFLILAGVGSDGSTITYQMEDMTGGLKKLVRTREGIPMLIAEYLFYDPVGNPDISTKIIAYDDTNYKLSIQIAARSGNTTIVKKYVATQRVPTQ